MSTKEIRAAALKLPKKSRIQLAHELLDSASDREQREIDAAWAEEVERRIEAYESGKTKLLPLSRVMKDLRKRVRDAR